MPPRRLHHRRTPRRRAHPQTTRHHIQRNPLLCLTRHVTVPVPVALVTPAIKTIPAIFAIPAIPTTRIPIARNLARIPVISVITAIPAIPAIPAIAAIPAAPSPAAGARESFVRLRVPETNATLIDREVVPGGRRWEVCL